MSANCGDYGKRRGVGICNEFPIAFMPHILWLCASAIQAEHPQGLETDKSNIGFWTGSYSNAKCSQIGSIYSFSSVHFFLYNAGLIPLCSSYALVLPLLFSSSIHCSLYSPESQICFKGLYSLNNSIIKLTSCGFSGDYVSDYRARLGVFLLWWLH